MRRFSYYINCHGRLTVRNIAVFVCEPEKTGRIISELS